MIDFSVWDELLQEYVNVSGEVDYQRWQLEAKQDLNQWLNSNSNLQLKQLTQQEALATLINLYNALVISEVLEQYPVKSIRPTLVGIPNWLAFLRFFSKGVYRLNNNAVSLNDIEHKILRQQWNEPRIHFALVCAARGCPWLRNEAYQPDRINEQLEADATRFINNSQKVRYLPESNLLQCSQIFKWYEKDFLQAASSVSSYVNEYLSVQLSRSVSIQYLPYDWRLNEQI